MCPRTQGKAVTSEGSLVQTYMLVFEGLLGSQGVAEAHCGNKDSGGKDSGEYSLA